MVLEAKQIKNLKLDALSDVDLTTQAPATHDSLRWNGSEYVPLKNNMTAVIPPTATDDDAAGYSIGSNWLDEPGGVIYQCVVATTAAAFWMPISSGIFTFATEQELLVFPLPEGSSAYATDTKRRYVRLNGLWQSEVDHVLYREDKFIGATGTATPGGMLQIFGPPQANYSFKEINEQCHITVVATVGNNEVSLAPTFSPTPMQDGDVYRFSGRISVPLDLDDDGGLFLGLFDNDPSGSSFGPPVVNYLAAGLPFRSGAFGPQLMTSSSSVGPLVVASANLLNGVNHATEIALIGPDQQVELPGGYLSFVWEVIAKDDKFVTTLYVNGNATARGLMPRERFYSPSKRVYATGATGAFTLDEPFTTDDPSIYSSFLEGTITDIATSIRVEVDKDSGANYVAGDVITNVTTGLAVGSVVKVADIAGGSSNQVLIFASTTNPITAGDALRDAGSTKLATAATDLEDATVLTLSGVVETTPTNPSDGSIVKVGHTITGTTSTRSAVVEAFDFSADQNIPYPFFKILTLDQDAPCTYVLDNLSVEVTNDAATALYGRAKLTAGTIRSDLTSAPALTAALPGQSFLTDEGDEYIYVADRYVKGITTAEIAKLAAIEALADVTDAANVAAAGAVMESDTTTAAMNFVINEDSMGSDSDTKVPTQQSVKAYVDNSVVGALTYKGGYNAATNTPDLDSGPPISDLGDMYTVTVAGTFFTVPVEIGDVLIAEIDNAAVEADWTIVNKNIDTAVFTDVASQISALTLVTAAPTDHIMIEDTSDANNKKRIAASDLLDGGITKTGPTTISDTFTATMDTVSDASVRTVKWLISIAEDIGVQYAASEVLATHDGTSVFYTEYAIVGNFVDYALAVDLSGGDMRLRITNNAGGGDTIDVSVARIELDI